MCETVWKHLLYIYEESRMNAGKPECLFAETLIFNEGWLLRSVLKEWKTSSTNSRLTFLPFPVDARIYSEGQLRIPFKVRRKSERTGEPKGETNTHVDGIVGDFSIGAGTKSGIELASGCRYVAVFEAKLYSPIGKGTKNAPDYDQVSRTTACLIHSLLEAEPRQDHEANIAVLYSDDNLDINPREFDKVHLRERIGKRLAENREAGDTTPEVLRFETGWEKMFDHVDLHFKTWEEVLDEIGDESLWEFYRLCKKYNQKHQEPSEALQRGERNAP